MTRVVFRHNNVPVTQLISHPRRALCDAPIAMAFKRAAHKHVQAMLSGVHNDGQRNVHVSPQMNLVGIGNMVDDEFARIERLLFMAMVVVAIGSFSPEVLRRDREKRSRALGKWSRC